MGDQKRWFKVWGSIVGDPHFGELPLEDVARWALLGAYVAVHGTGGRLTVPGDARELCHILRVGSKVAAIEALERLPNVHVTHHTERRFNRDDRSYPQCHFEEGKNRDGEFTVTLSNWRIYQEDSTQAQRMKTLRSKRRRESTTTPTSTSPERSAVEKGSTSAEDDPPGHHRAPAVSPNGHGPLAGVVAGVLASIAARGARALETVPPGHEAI